MQDGLYQCYNWREARVQGPDNFSLHVLDRRVARIALVGFVETRGAAELGINPPRKTRGDSHRPNSREIGPGSQTVSSCVTVS